MNASVAYVLGWFLALAVTRWVTSRIPLKPAAKPQTSAREFRLSPRWSKAVRILEVLGVVTELDELPPPPVRTDDATLELLGEADWHVGLMMGTTHRLGRKPPAGLQ